MKLHPDGSIEFDKVEDLLAYEARKSHPARVVHNVTNITNGHKPSESAVPHRYRMVTLSERQWTVLEIMREADQVAWKAASLAELTGLSRDQVSTALHNISGKGLIERIEGHWLWRLTDRGTLCPVGIGHTRQPM